MPPAIQSRMTVSAVGAIFSLGVGRRRATRVAGRQARPAWRREAVFEEIAASRDGPRRRPRGIGVKRCSVNQLEFGQHRRRAQIN